MSGYIKKSQRKVTTQDKEHFWCVDGIYPNDADLVRNAVNGLGEELIPDDFPLADRLSTFIGD